MESAKNRFIDDIPFEVVRGANTPDFLAGKKTAEAGKKRDKSKSLDWILGYDSVKKKQQ
jgi:hypothetical protein